MVVTLLLVSHTPPTYLAAFTGVLHLTLGTDRLVCRTSREGPALTSSIYLTNGQLTSADRLTPAHRPWLWQTIAVNQHWPTSSGKVLCYRQTAYPHVVMASSRV